MTTRSSQAGGSILSRSQCLALASTVAVGRFAWADEGRRVTVVPVNFVLIDGDVVFRCAPGAKLNAIRAGRPGAFEVDDFESATRTGWSVLISGAVREITDPNEAAELTASLAPWEQGEHPHVVRLQSETVTGRRLTLQRGGVSVVELAASGDEEAP